MSTRRVRDRQVLNMAALAAMGGVEPQLTGYIRTAVDMVNPVRSLTFGVSI